jgi:cytoskeletal protein RodZ
MKTVGNILKEARSTKKLSLERVEEVTKIRKKFLVAIEDDDYTKLPSIAYAKGFVKNYAEFLGLNTTHVLAFFRRQTRESYGSTIAPKGLTEPLNASLFRLTPTRFLAGVISILLISFLLYFGLQYRRIQLPPQLVIESPKSNIIVPDKQIDILGRTDPDATVTINGVTVLLRGDGQFYDKLNLETGTNTITIVATSRFGKSNKIDKKVIYQP